MPVILLGNIVWILLVALGVSLVSVGWRARSPAEAVLGVGITCMAPGAWLVAFAMQTKAFTVGAAGVALFGLGTLTLPAFTYLVFRRDLPAARLLAFALIAFAAFGTAHQIHRIFVTAAGAEVSPSVPFFASRALATGWAALEALRYRRMYVKRLALGLADPVIANRFFLYAIWTGVMALMAAGTLTGSLASEALGVRWQSFVLKPMRLVGLIAGVAVYLNFLPPAAYLRWIEARHARSAP